MEENITKNIFKSPCICTLIGSKGSGKTHVLEYMLYNCMIHNKFKFGIIFSVTKQLNHAFSFIPDKYIYDDIENFEKIFFNYVEMLFKKYGDKIPNNFIVLDDCLNTFSINNKFKSFITTFRHSHITMFITSQYANADLLGQIIKEQVDYSFIFYQHTERSKDAIAQFIGFKNGQKYDEFAQIYNAKRFNMLFYDANAFENDGDVKFMKFICPDYKMTQKFKY